MSSNSYHELGAGGAVFHVYEPILPLMGGCRYRINQIIELKDDPCKIFVLPSNQDPQLIYTRYPRSVLLKSKISIPRSGGVGKYVKVLLFSAETALILRKAWKKYHPTFMYGHGASAVLALRLADLKQLSVVLDIFETELPHVMMTNSMSAFAKPFETLEEKMVRVADAYASLVLVLTETMKTYLMNKYELLPTSLEVLYDTIDPSIYQIEDGENQESNHKILFMGDVYYRDGVDVLVEALNLVKRDVPDVELYVTAGGPQLPMVLKKAEKLNVLKNIRMTGWIPFSQLVSMLPTFAVGVSPSRNKLLNSLIIPRKVFEYMAAGVPVVASRLEAMNEIITHRETGMLVEPEDPQDLAEAIVTLLTDHTLSRRIKQRARKAIENHDMSVQKKMSALFSSGGKD